MRREEELNAAIIDGAAHIHGGTLQGKISKTGEPASKTADLSMPAAMRAS